MLDFQRDGVAAELALPLAELELSFKQPLLANPAEAFAKNQDALKAYIAGHITPQTVDGKKWSVSVQSLSLQTNQQPFDLVAQVWMQPPPGASPRKFIFYYSVINHEVMSHNAYVSVRNDWDTAVFSNRPEFIGDIHFTITSLTINRSRSSWWQGFRTVFNLGVHHITEGTDHLLFLLVLLLPAPLLCKCVAAGFQPAVESGSLPPGKGAQNFQRRANVPSGPRLRASVPPGRMPAATPARWGGFGGFRRSSVQLLKIVSAFTLGHSLTLALGATGWARLPGRPVEILIALSILISAVHAFRPVFAGREVFIAGGFGLIHGLAFAGSLAEFGFSPWTTAFTILGFNLGIEAMQLVVVAATVPWLLLLARTELYSPVRIFGAAFGAVAALGWLAERAFHWPNPLNAVVAALANHSLWLVGTLATLALLATGWQQMQSLLFHDECENRLSSN